MEPLTERLCHMLTHEIVLFRFVKSYLHTLLADIEAAEMTFQPSAGINTPSWIVGHLAIANDLAGKYLGLAPVCPPEWGQYFSPGTQPVPGEGQTFPSKAVLLDTFDRGHAAVLAAATEARPELLDQPHDIPVEYVRTTFPTKGNFIAHLMTTHAATHLGQLSVWRRLTGRPPVLG
jgi:hypothetical protein